MLRPAKASSGLMAEWVSTNNQRKYKTFKESILTEIVPVNRKLTLLCRLQSTAGHRDNFVRRLSVRPCVCPLVCLSGSHTYLVVTHSFVLRATHAIHKPVSWQWKCTQNWLLLDKIRSDCKQFNRYTILIRIFSIDLTKPAENFSKKSSSVLKGSI